MDHTTNVFRPHDAMELWLDQCAVEGKSSYTIRNYREAISAFLKTSPLLDVKSITSNHVIAHLARVRGTGVEASTVAWHQRHLNAWLGWLYDRGDLDRDPRRGIQRVRVIQKKLPAVTPDMKDALVKTLSDRPQLPSGRQSAPANYYRNLAVVEVLWATWARREELAMARWEDIDWRRRSLLLRHTKTGKERLVPLTDAAVMRLREYHIREAGRVERGPLFGMTGNAIRLMLARAGERAGVQVNAHAWRRGGVSYARAKGIDIAHAMHIMGHSTPTMTLRYSASGEDDAALEAYRRLLG